MKIGLRKTGKRNDIIFQIYRVVKNPGSISMEKNNNKTK